MSDGKELDSHQDSEPDNWRRIAEQASQEHDFEVLCALVQKLCKALDQRSLNVTQPQPVPAQSKSDSHPPAAKGPLPVTGVIAKSGTNG